MTLRPFARLVLLVTACALRCIAQAATAADGGLTDQDWPCWRGPSHDGHARSGQQVPLTWSDAEHVVWITRVPGRGNGSPTVVGDHVYLASCDETTGSQTVYAFDRNTGRPVWERQVHASGAMRKNARSSGASATIACDGDRLFVNFATAGAVFVTCLSRDGTILWQTRLCDYQIHQGFGASPLVHGDLVLAVADHQGGGAVGGLDRRTGAVVWRRDRPPTPNYSSPIVHHLFGRDQLILIGCNQVASYDPTTGKTLWEQKGSTTECVTTTVTDGSRIYSTGGYPRNHVAAIMADGSGTVSWENGERVYVPSMLHHEGHLYALLDAGIAACWDAATGAERWKRRLGGNFSGSPVLLDGRIYATNEQGETHVFRAIPTAFESLATNKLGDEAFASPAICGGRIYLRVARDAGGTRQEQLCCIGLAPQPSR